MIIAILICRYNRISSSCDRSILFCDINEYLNLGLVIARIVSSKVRDQCGEADEQHQAVIRLPFRTQ